jgi:hypothetical protein
MKSKREISEDDYQQVIRTLRARMATNAFGPDRFLEPRNGLILKRAGFAVDCDPPKRADEELIAILRDPGHERRIGLPPGPLVCYLEEGLPSRSILEIRNLLLLEDRILREAALDHFLGLRGVRPRCLTPRSEAIIAGSADGIRSEEWKQWGRAAIELHDALTDDFLLALAGFLQCRSLGYREGTDDFLNDVLRPRLSAIDSIPLSVLNPSQEREKLRELISDVASHSAGLEEAGDSFMALAGHLPLDHSLGLARAMKPWIDLIPPADVWTRVWAWAEGTGSPAARYHACLLFLEIPASVPEGKQSTLRDEILEVISPGLATGDAEEAPRYVAWRVRCDLACHYEQYLESFLPGLESERIAHLAWWLAERVAHAFGDTPEHLRNVHAGVVLPTRELSSGLWEVVRPPLEPSPLRFATLFVTSTWSLSLLAQLGPLHSVGTLVDLLGDRGDELERPLMASVVLGFPPPWASDGPVTYGFERTPAATVGRWIAERNNVGATAILQAGLAVFLSSAEPGERSRRLDRLPRVGPEEQALIAHNLKVLAFSGAPPDGIVFDRLIDQDWAKSTFDGLSLGALELFCDALFELLHRHGGRWRTSLPHILASGALDPSNEPERRSLLLAYSVLFSIAAGTTGAVTRILLAEDRHHLARDLDYWRYRLEELFGVCSPWAQSRIRPVLAQLSTGQESPPSVLQDEAGHESIDSKAV